MYFLRLSILLNFYLCSSLSGAQPSLRRYVKRTARYRSQLCGQSLHIRKQKNVQTNHGRNLGKDRPSRPHMIRSGSHWQCLKLSRPSSGRVKTPTPHLRHEVRTRPVTPMYLFMFLSLFMFITFCHFCPSIHVFTPTPLRFFLFT